MWRSSMRHLVRLVGFSLGMLAAAFELQSCARDCEQNGSCFEGTQGVGGAAGSGGTTTRVECSDVSDCPDPGLCMVKTCQSGTCESEAVTDGSAVDETTCGRKCQVEGPRFTGAGELCEGNQVCDGNGNCVGCDDGHVCPPGYGCTSNGQCKQGLGIACPSDGCADANCEDGICCAVACGTCRVCDPNNFEGCTFSPYGTIDPGCPMGKPKCDGNGNCLP